MTQWYSVGSNVLEESPMTDEPFDEYIDQFVAGTGPFGVTLTFQRTPAKPGSPGQPQQAIEIGTVRMSLEHLKAMAYVLKGQVDQAEEQQGITIPVSVKTLNAMSIAPEDWDKFWKQEE